MTNRLEGTRGTWFALLLAALLVGGCVEDEPAGPAGRDTVAARAEEARGAAAEAAAIRAVLEAQMSAWNAGDLAGYMDGYAREDSLRFASGGDVWYGWETTYNRYRESYADSGAMGRLTFSAVDVRLLDPQRAVVFGRWALQRSEAYTNVSGLFTLLFAKRPEGWRIIHDHTSTKEDL